MMDYSGIRAQARANLKDRWALAIAVAAVALLLGGTMSGSSFLPQFQFHFRGEDLEMEDLIESFLTFSSQFGGTFIRVNALGLAGFILGGVIQLGYAKILLKQHAHKDYAFADLFSEFDRFGTGFAQKFLRGLYSFLWSLLFVIPGIIKALSYAMTPYIMADHPELTASQAIDYSKELMEGHKWELFVLHLTFIGWDFLAALTLNIGHLVLNPYKNAAEAAFYREIAGYPGYTTE